jgi:aspartate aminotransferase
MRAAGRRIVDFTIGEPDFPTPPHIVEGGVAALLAGYTRYTASNGTPALRQAIADKLLRENALTYRPEHIAVGNGAKHIIYNAFAATLNEGDEVIAPAPYWVSYPDMVALHGGTPVAVPSSPAEGFKLTPAALEAAITSRTRWLVLNTPNNPTGVVYRRGELAAIGEVLERHPQAWADDRRDLRALRVRRRGACVAAEDLYCRFGRPKQPGEKCAERPAFDGLTGARGECSGARLSASPATASPPS